MAEIDYHGSWRDGCRELERRIADIAPVGGPGIRLEKTGRGTRITAVTAGDGDDGYRGYFKVVSRRREDGLFLAVLDGAALSAEESTAAPAGYAVVNDALLELPAGELRATGAGGSLYAEFELLASGLTAFVDYRLAPESPGNADLRLNIVLATYTLQKERLTVIQQHHGRLYGWIFRECDSIE